MREEDFELVVGDDGKASRAYALVASPVSGPSNPSDNRGAPILACVAVGEAKVWVELPVQKVLSGQHA